MFSQAELSSRQTEESGTARARGTAQTSRIYIANKRSISLRFLRLPATVMQARTHAAIPPRVTRKSLQGSAHSAMVDIDGNKVPRRVSLSKEPLVTMKKRKKKKQKRKKKAERRERMR